MKLEPFFSIVGVEVVLIVVVLSQLCVRCPIMDNTGPPIDQMTTINSPDTIMPIAEAHLII